MAQPKVMRQLSVMRLWLTPGMGVKRHVALAAVGTLLLVFGVVAGALWLLDDIGGSRQAISQPIEDLLVGSSWRMYGGWVALATVLLGIVLAVVAIGRLNRSLLSNWMPQPRDAALVLHRRLSLAKGAKIVAIGGGTGLSNLLRGLRHYSSNLTAVVTVSDDGGSSGRLRSAFDMPAPGDLSDCLAALSDNELEVSRLLQYRFDRGEELTGHTFGNLIITTLTEVEGDFAKAIRVLNSLLNLTGSVYPVSPEPISLSVVKEGGVEVKGESKVSTVAGAIERLMIEPVRPRATPEVISGILNAEVVVLGPGSLFTSTLPPLLVPGVQRALVQARARVVYVCNIMTEAGETDGFSVFDHVQALFEHLGRYPDQVIVNRTPVDPERRTSYESEGASVVTFDPEPFNRLGIEVVSLPLLGAGPHAQHDSLTLAAWLAETARSTTSSKLKDDGKVAPLVIGLAVAAWLFVQDPVGDTSALQPPTASVYRSLSPFDVTALEITDAPELTFNVTLGSLANPFELPNGFSFPILELYLSNETEGSAELLPGSQMSLPEGATWRYALRVTGDRVQVFAAENGNVLEVTASQTVELTRDGTALSLKTSLPRPDTGSVYGLVGSYSPFSLSGWQPLSALPSPWAFSSDTTTLPVIEVIAEDDAAQARALQTGILPPLRPAVTPERGWNGWLALMIAGGFVALAGVVGRFRVGGGAATLSAERLEEGVGTSPTQKDSDFQTVPINPDTRDLEGDKAESVDGDRGVSNSPFSGDAPATLELIPWLTSGEEGAAEFDPPPPQPPDTDADDAAKPPT